ncbi:hypothetical protein DL93DRAFT_292212 [Clavulina sp. PMI_390]|nr:hypothetical protein DL93DRAFT_292212 [Clavulina sp. PMI_390]
MAYTPCLVCRSRNDCCVPGPNDTFCSSCATFPLHLRVISGAAQTFIKSLDPALNETNTAFSPSPASSNLNMTSTSSKRARKQKPRCKCEFFVAEFVRKCEDVGTRILPIAHGNARSARGKTKRSPPMLSRGATNGRLSGRQEICGIEIIAAWMEARLTSNPIGPPASSSPSSSVPPPVSSLTSSSASFPAGSPVLNTTSFSTAAVLDTAAHTEQIEEDVLGPRIPPRLARPQTFRESASPTTLTWAVKSDGSTINTNRGVTKEQGDTTFAGSTVSSNPPLTVVVQSGSDHR